MFKLSKFVRALLAVGLSRITPEETGGNAGGGDGGAPSGTLPTPNAWDSVPRSWAAEHHSHWGSVSPEVRKIIHDRDANYERGIQGYRQSHERWERLSKPFAEFTANQPDADLTGLFENLAGNHLALAKATPAERKTMLRNLAKHYGVEFGPDATPEGQGSQGPDSSKAFEQMLEKALSPIQSRFKAMDDAELAKRQGEAAKAIDTFFSDKKNVFASEVAPLMVQILREGRAPDIESAYIQACLGTPGIKEKYLASLSAPAEGEEGAEAEASNVRNLKSNGNGAPPGKPKTIDDTMNAVLRKHYPGYRA